MRMHKDHVAEREDGWHIVNVCEDGTEFDDAQAFQTREAAENWRLHVLRVTMLLNAGAETETIEEGGRLYAKFKQRVDN